MIKNEKIIREYVERIKEIYESHVTKIILYGSYARGDNTEDSDIDILILLDMSDEDAKKYQDALFDSAYDFSMDYNVEINPIYHDEALFDKWLPVYPFFQNIKRDGVLLYGAA